MKFLEFAKKAFEDKTLLEDYLYTRDEKLHVEYHLDHGNESILNIVYYTSDNKDLENIQSATLTEGNKENGTIQKKQLNKEEIKLILSLGFFE